MDAFRNEFYGGEGSVNLREFRGNGGLGSGNAGNNLDLCDDDLFEDLFPSTSKEIELGKNGEGSANDGMRTPLQSEADGHPGDKDDRTQENSAIKQHVLYLMDQLPHSSSQNPYPTVPKQEADDVPSNPSSSCPESARLSSTTSDKDPVYESPLTPGEHYSSSSNSSMSSTPFVPSMSQGTKELVSSMIKAEPVDIEELTQKRSRRGRKRKSTESENELTRAYDRENNEYKKKRLRNNIAVRKSRDKAKQRQMEVQSKLVALADENKAQKQMIEKIKGDYDTIEQRFEELNKRLEETLKVNGRMRQFIDTLPNELQPKFPF